CLLRCLLGGGDDLLGLLRGLLRSLLRGSLRSRGGGLLGGLLRSLLGGLLRGRSGLREARLGGRRGKRLERGAEQFADAHLLALRELHQIDLLLDGQADGDLTVGFGYRGEARVVEAGDRVANDLALRYSELLLVLVEDSDKVCLQVECERRALSVLFSGHC